MNVETKMAAAELKMGADSGLEAGEFVAVMSDETLDRDGEIIKFGAFDPLPARIPVDIDHELTADGTVGSGVPYYEGKKLMIKGSFASDERSQELRQKVLDGHITSLSVAFRAAEREQKNDDGPILITKADLMNVAFVAIPANPNAQLVGAKSATIEDDEATVAEKAAEAGVTDAEIAEAEVVDLTGEPDDEATKESDEPAEEMFTLDQARERLEAEQEVERNQALLRTLTDPAIVKNRFGATTLPTDKYAEIIGDSKNVGLVVIPDGVDYVQAAKAAQTAVDEFSATAPAEADVKGSAAASAAADPDTAATARAQAKQATEAANRALAKIKGLNT